MEPRLPDTLRLLVSYALINIASGNVVQRMLDEGADVILDSGAFTAFSKGTPINLDGYMEYLHTLPKSRALRYMALDVIGDPAATLLNYDVMRSNGLTPIPVVQRGASMAEAEHYAGTSSLVAFGGLVGRSQTYVMRQVQPYLPALGGTPFHLLGTTSAPLCSRLRPASVDASSWDAAGRFGVFSMYCGGGRIKAISRADYTGPQRMAIAGYVQSLGYDPQVLLKDSEWRGRNSLSSEISARSWIEYGRDLQAHTGTTVYIATVEARLGQVIKAWRNNNDG